MDGWIFTNISPLTVIHFRIFEEEKRITLCQYKALWKFLAVLNVFIVTVSIILWAVCTLAITAVFDGRHRLKESGKHVPHIWTPTNSLIA